MAQLKQQKTVGRHRYRLKCAKHRTEADLSDLSGSVDQVYQRIVDECCQEVRQNSRVETSDKEGRDLKSSSGRRVSSGRVKPSYAAKSLKSSVPSHESLDPPDECPDVEKISGDLECVKLSVVPSPTGDMQQNIPGNQGAKTDQHHRHPAKSSLASNNPREKVLSLPANTEASRAGNSVNYVKVWKAFEYAAIDKHVERQQHARLKAKAQQRHEQQIKEKRLRSTTRNRNPEILKQNGRRTQMSSKPRTAPASTSGGGYLKNFSKVRKKSRKNEDETTPPAPATKGNKTENNGRLCRVCEYGHRIHDPLYITIHSIQQLDNRIRHHLNMSSEYNLYRIAAPSQTCLSAWPEVVSCFEQLKDGDHLWVTRNVKEDTSFHCEWANKRYRIEEKYYSSFADDGSRSSDTSESQKSPIKSKPKASVESKSKTNQSKTPMRLWDAHGRCLAFRKELL